MPGPKLLDRQRRAVRAFRKVEADPTGPERALRRRTQDANATCEARARDLSGQAGGALQQATDARRRADVAMRRVGLGYLLREAKVAATDSTSTDAEAGLRRNVLAATQAASQIEKGTIALRRLREAREVQREPALVRPQSPEMPSIYLPRKPEISRRMMVALSVLTVILCAGLAFLGVQAIKWVLGRLTTAIGLTSSMVQTDEAALVEHVTVPEGASVVAGEQFVRRRRIRNTGTSTWGQGYRFVFVSGNRMSGPVSMIVSHTPPGGSAAIRVFLRAPGQAGLHEGYWRLQNASGADFGPLVSLSIRVAQHTSVPPRRTKVTSGAVPVSTRAVTSPVTPVRRPTVSRSSQLPGAPPFSQTVKVGALLALGPCMGLVLTADRPGRVFHRWWDR